MTIHFFVEHLDLYTETDLIVYILSLKGTQTFFKNTSFMSLIYALVYILPQKLSHQYWDTIITSQHNILSILAWNKMTGFIL